ncbi:hypothetical protein HGRIS_006160 [Hohenbuehelia grisea]|uniref:Uncharacterized protein n=1 Tax=Hohenbuehelia grisea TaxID=104357 RepID=A0ABR3K0A0_9AGAR
MRKNSCPHSFHPFSTLCYHILVLKISTSTMHLSKTFSVILLFTVAAVTAFPLSLFQAPVLQPVSLEEAGVLVSTSADHGLPDEELAGVSDATEVGPTNNGDSPDDGPLYVTSNWADPPQDDLGDAPEDSDASDTDLSSGATKEVPTATVEPYDVENNAALGADSELEALSEFAAAIEPVDLDVEEVEDIPVDQGEYDGGEPAADDKEYNEGDEDEEEGDADDDDAEDDDADEDEDDTEGGDVDDRTGDPLPATGAAPTATFTDDEATGKEDASSEGDYSSKDAWDVLPTAAAGEGGADEGGDNVSSTAGTDAGMTEDGDLFALAPPADGVVPVHDSDAAAPVSDLVNSRFADRRPISHVGGQVVTDENGLLVSADDVGMVHRVSRRRRHVRKRTPVPQPKVILRRHVKRASVLEPKVVRPARRQLVKRVLEPKTRIVKRMHSQQDGCIAGFHDNSYSASL